MKSRIVIAFFALVVSAVVALVEFDQQSRLSPSYAVLVPDAFSGNAARERSKLALQIGSADIAVAEARTQVSLRPMPAESLTILALASLQSGDQETARKALESASRRGWREPISQLASARGAFEQGAYEIASQRVVALLSTGNLRDSALALLAQLVALPEGREAMASRMASFGRWQGNTLTQAADFANPDDWAATVSLAIAKGAELPCEQLRRLGEKYSREGHDAAANVIGRARDEAC